VNPFRLTGTTPDGREAKVWGCGVCLHVCLNEEHAKRCCVCSYCGKPTDNAEDRGKRQTYHRSCMHADWIRKDQERLDIPDMQELTQAITVGGEPFFYVGIADAKKLLKRLAEVTAERDRLAAVVKLDDAAMLDDYRKCQVILNDYVVGGGTLAARLQTALHGLKARLAASRRSEPSEEEETR